MELAPAKKALVNAEEELAAATTIAGYREVQETLATITAQLSQYDPAYAFDMSPELVLREKAEAAMAAAEEDGLDALRPAAFGYELWSLSDAKYAEVTVSENNVVGLVLFEVIEKLWRVVRANDDKPV